MTYEVLKKTHMLKVAAALVGIFFIAGILHSESVFAWAGDSSDSFDSGQTVTLDLASGQVVNYAGEEADPAEYFDPMTAAGISEAETQEEQAHLEKQLEADSRYVVSPAEEGKLKVAFPFANKRLLVFAEEGTLTDSYGAVGEAYYEAAGEYILDYASDQDAAKAYEFLAAQFGTENVLPDLPVKAADAGGEPYTSAEALSYSWGVDMMGLDVARDKANRSSELKGPVTVAVLDSGINPDHELFRGRLDEAAASFVDGSTYSTDDSGHGTHVAGIIADGTSDQIQILPVKVLDGEGHGGFADVINGIYYAAEQKAHVINMSLAINLSDYGNYWSDTAVLQEERALEQAEKQGAICVAAAGNDSMNLDTLKVYPATSQHTLTISSITAGRERAASSNYGESVDYTAPGDQIRSADAGDPQRFCVKSGTSMAAPHFSAACAMIILYNPGIDKSGLAALLDGQAADLGPEGKDKKFGAGLITFSEGNIPVAAKDIVPETISISAASVTLPSSIQYTGKAQKPKPVVRLNGKVLQERADYIVNWTANTNVGTARVTIRGNGKYIGTVTKAFTIRPKGTTLGKSKGKKRGLIIKWKMQTTRMEHSRVTGYQIQYTTNSSFKKDVRTVTVRGYQKKSFRLKKLAKGKKYYLRIRTYMKTGGKTYCSAWSRSKTCRTK